MPRPVWTGAISFGMVTIPVRLAPAVRRHAISFNQLDGETMSRIRYRKVSEQTGDEVPSEQIVKAAPIGADRYVVVTDDELASVQPKRSKAIDLESFVPASSIAPEMFDSSYHVLPDGTAKPYKLLARAIADADRVAIGRFVMRNKAHLAAIRSDGKHLQLSTLVFPDELVTTDSLDEFTQLDGVELADKELTMAASLIDALSEDFEPERYVDDYRVALQELIDAKAAGEEVSVGAEPADAAVVIDLAEALQKSLAEAQGAKERHPSGAAGSSGARTAKGGKKATAKKSTAKRSGAKKSA